VLKLNYTESGFHLEQLDKTIAQLLQERVLLALRVEQTLYIEPSTAGFLLALSDAEMVELENVLQQQPSQFITIYAADDSLVEVNVEGTWVAENAEAEVGIFVTHLPEPVEHFIYNLWKITQAEFSSVI
jgi:hypothetical protein